jgi:hypothetical protein
MELGSMPLDEIREFVVWWGRLGAQRCSTTIKV